MRFSWKAGKVTELKITLYSRINLALLPFGEAVRNTIFCSISPCSSLHAHFTFLGQVAFQNSTALTSPHINQTSSQSHSIISNDAVTINAQSPSQVALFLYRQTNLGRVSCRSRVYLLVTPIINLLLDRF